MPDEVTILPGFDPECETCQGDGYLDLYTDHLEQSVMPPRCPRCNAEPVELEPAYPDVDGDGWLDGVVKVPARYTGGRLELAKVDTIVIHRYWLGWWAAGPQYFTHPTKRDPETGEIRARYVSAHFSVHRPGWQRMLTQQAPISTKCWHAPPLNSTSLGIEHDGPFGGPWDDEMIAVSVALVESLQELLPNLRRLVSHRWVCPRTRRDPGPAFPWGEYERLGLEIVR